MWNGGLGAMTISTVGWGDVPTWIQTFVVIAAVVLAIVQLRNVDDSRRIDRVLELHREMTTGDVGAARDRLVPVIFAGGSARQLTLAEFRTLGLDDGHRPANSVVVVLRAFERAWESYDSGRLDRRMARKLFASTAAWWNLAFARVEANELPGIDQLRFLAQALDDDGHHRARHLAADFRPD